MDKARLSVASMGVLFAVAGILSCVFASSTPEPLLLFIVGAIFGISGIGLILYAVFAKHVEIDVTVNGRTTHYTSDREDVKKEEPEDVSEWGDHRLSFQEK